MFEILIGGSISGLTLFTLVTALRVWSLVMTRRLRHVSFLPILMWFMLVTLMNVDFSSITIGLPIIKAGPKPTYQYELVSGI